METNMINELISAVRKRCAAKDNLCDILSELLCKSREAIYRRLRGEVSFTFSEIALISRHFNISLDQLTERNIPSGAVFNLKLHHPDNPMERYYETLSRYAQIFRFLLNGAANTEVMLAANVLPFIFYSSYKHILKFRLCHWMYLHNWLKTPMNLPDIHIPEKWAQIDKELNENMRKVERTCFIWDSNLFASFIREIRYFAGLRLISPTDIEVLKEELHQMLNEMERLSVRGHFPNGGKVNIYLSSLNLEATYMYVEGPDFLTSLFRIYSMNWMDSQDPNLCKQQKMWINFLKRHSTLISQSGELHRIAFFDEQRRIVDALHPERTDTSTFPACGKD